MHTCTSAVICVSEKHVFGSVVTDAVNQQNHFVFSSLHSLLCGIIKLVPM